jgi:hypothetical protein
MRHLAGLASLPAIFALSLFRPASAQDLREQRFMTEVQAGFAEIFNLDHDEARTTFSRLQCEHPRHPAPALYVAVTLWLRELFEREDLDLGKFSRSISIGSV